MTAPVTAPRRSWMGATESSIETSVPSRRTSTQFGSKRYRFVFANRLRHGILRGDARLSIDELEHVLNRMPYRFLLRPTGQVFSGCIQIGDLTRDIRAHDRVANRVERHLRALLFLKQRFGIGGTLDHAPHGLGQQVSVKMGFKEIILGSTLYRQFPGLLVLRINQDQDRNPGRRVKETVKRVSMPRLSGSDRSTNIAALPASLSRPSEQHLTHSTWTHLWSHSARSGWPWQPPHRPGSEVCVETWGSFARINCRGRRVHHAAGAAVCTTTHRYSERAETLLVLSSASHSKRSDRSRCDGSRRRKPHRNPLRELRWTSRVIMTSSRLRGCGLPCCRLSPLPICGLAH